MKKILPLLLVIFLISCGTKNEKQSAKGKPPSEIKPAKEVPSFKAPGLSIDLESLKDNIDLNMDINQLNLAEIRVLRNAFFARQGYCFMKADIRGIFSTTSWYDRLMEDRFWAEDEGQSMPEISLTADEQEFVDKLLKREEELRKENFIHSSGQTYANLNNLVNLYQMKDIDPKIMNKLAENGFAIVPGKEIQLFHVYEENDYRQFPSFVTTDMYLQIMHMYFGYVLRTLEEERFIPILKDITESMMEEMKNLSVSDPNPDICQLAAHNFTYYAIAYSLLTDTTMEVIKGYESMYQQEMKHISSQQDDFSVFLEYQEAMFPYSLFKPRGHYTRTEELKGYFRAMMWLQTAPFCLDNEQQLKRAILNADVLAKNAREPNSVLSRYESILNPVSFLIGEPDNLSVYQISKMLIQQNLSIEDLVNDKKSFEDFRQKLKVRADALNRIRPKEALSCVDRINFMPQRYLPDNEVLQELVDVDSPESKRAYPKGLDVMAAFGSHTAEDLLLNEIGEGEVWDKYPEKLNKLKSRMKGVNWDATVYNKWIKSLLKLQVKDKRYPYFMQTAAWAKKDLNASLASWAELKHDAILYAEQPMAAECGGGGPPDPYTPGYIEPNVYYWATAIGMIDMTLKVLHENDLVLPDVDRISGRLKENAEFLLAASKKELAGQNLSEQEYHEIEYIGSTFEWITLDLVKQKDQWLDGWHNVEGPDRKVAVVADVYTSNAMNNPDPGVLHVATGNVNDIYVVVEIEGYLYLTRGAVLEYREFHMPPGQRLTDEEWQDLLESEKAGGVPGWMKEILVPVDKPRLNEKIFYSSGC
ncbi:MAG: DUF3160 domain-containing protein [Bacteroidales bacterium]|nr:DUF3160 domain-containing protein [Bacteroidales bacterium]